MAIEEYEKRFGAIAVENGFIPLEQLLEAMRIQVTEDVIEKKHRPIGQILLELGYITDEQVREVLNIVEAEAT
jgi:hypothetical protein